MSNKLSKKFIIGGIIISVIVIIASLIAIILLLTSNKQEVNQITISFDVDGANTVEKITVEKGKSVVLPTPIKEGFVFDGWYLDNQKITDTSVLDKDVILKAKWQESQQPSNNKVNVSSISLNVSSKKIKVGESFNLSVSYNPSNATDKTIVWKSNDSSIATVQNGKVTGKKAGQVYIIATSSNGKKATCLVNVINNNSNPEYEIKYNTTKITKVVGVRPFTNPLTNTGSSKNITYTSDNPKVAVVDKTTGTVKLLGVGEATITAKTSDSSYKVKEASYKIVTQFNYIAYSQVKNSGKSINSKEHIDHVTKLSTYTSIKVDLQPTKDGGLVLCHDAGFTLKNCDRNYVKNHDDLSNCYVDRYSTDEKNAYRTINVSELTTKQATSLRHNDTKNHVTTFDYYVSVMKKYPNKMAFVTVRANITNNLPNSNNTYVDKVLEILKNNGIAERTIINALGGASNALDAFNRKDPNMMLSLVVSDNNYNIDSKYLEKVKSYGYAIFSLYIFRDEQSLTKKKILNNEFGNLKETVKSARENNIIIFTGTISDKTLIASNDYLINRGMSGSQVSALLN